MTEPNEAIELINCEDSEVLLFGEHTSLVQKLKKDLQDALKENASSILETLAYNLSNHSVRIIRDRTSFDEKWFEEGKKCKILRLGAKGWESGKLRIKVSLEFCPDEPEEDIEVDEIDQLEDSLDDLRQKFKQDH